jgi:hypothetical protein
MGEDIPDFPLEIFAQIRGGAGQVIGDELVRTIPAGGVQEVAVDLGQQHVAGALPQLDGRIAVKPGQG